MKYSDLKQVCSKREVTRGGMQIQLLRCYYSNPLLKKNLIGVKPTLYEPQVQNNTHFLFPQVACVKNRSCMRGKFIPTLSCLLTLITDLMLAAVFILIIILFLISISPVDLQAALLSLDLYLRPRPFT